MELSSFLGPANEFDVRSLFGVSIHHEAIPVKPAARCFLYDEHIPKLARFEQR
jgi:hypothetical protein